MIIINQSNHHKKNKINLAINCQKLKRNNSKNNNNFNFKLKKQKKLLKMNKMNLKRKII